MNISPLEILQIKLIGQLVNVYVYHIPEDDNVKTLFKLHELYEPNNPYKLKGKFTGAISDVYLNYNLTNHIQIEVLYKNKTEIIYHHLAQKIDKPHYVEK